MREVFVNITTRGPSDFALQGVTFEANVHKGHSKVHRVYPFGHNDFGQSVNIVNVDSQKYFEKKNLNKYPKTSSKEARRGLGILRSQRSQIHEKEVHDPWRCRWKRGW